MRTNPIHAPALLAILAACAREPQPGAARVRVAVVAQSSGTTAPLIAVSPVDERIVWVSGRQGTWLRTVDGGEHWHSGRVPGADTLQFRDVQGIDSSTAFLLSIGTGKVSRIYVTHDAGAHWTLQLMNPDSAGFYDCLSFWDRDRGIAVGDAVGDGLVILITRDAGAHWQRIPPSTLPRARPHEGSFAASGTCVATRPGGLAWIVMSDTLLPRVLRTADYGAHWSVNTPPITVRPGTGPNSVLFRDDLHGMVLGGGYTAARDDSESAITADGGLTWTPAARPPMRTGVWGGSYVPGAITPIVVAAGPNGAAYSTDDARSWIRLDTLNYWSVAFASPRAGWAVGTDGRITSLSFSR